MFDQIKKIRQDIDNITRSVIVESDLIDAIAKTVPILVVDDNLIIHQCSEPAAAVFGYKADELEGSSLNTVVPERFHESHTQIVKQYFLSPKIRKMGEFGKVFIARHKSGREFTIDIGLAPLPVRDRMFVLACIIELHCSVFSSIPQIGGACMGDVLKDIQAGQAIVDEICNADPNTKGSDLSVLLDKLVAWFSTLELGNYSDQALHALLHFVRDVVLPRVTAALPAYAGVLINAIVIPILNEIDARWHPEPVPGT